jgi:large subunit ribosomal protein L21
MYAIIKSGSRQYRVAPETVIEVNRLHLDEGAAFETHQVLLCDPDSPDVLIGAPFVAGARVTGKVLAHLRGRKVLVFKQKRRKNYKRTRGHRQELTRVLIESVEVGGKTFAIPPRPAGAKKAAAPQPVSEEGAAAEAAPGVAAKAAPQPARKAPSRESAAKKPAAKAKAGAAKKPAAKPPLAKKPAAKAKPAPGTGAARRPARTTRKDKE